MIADNTNSYELSEHAKINNVHGKKVFVVGSSGYVLDIDSSGGIPISISEYNPNNIDEATTTVTYIGTEVASGTWYVKKIDTTSGTVFGHATNVNNVGVTTYATAWTNRTTLTYGNYSEAF